MPLNFPNYPSSNPEYTSPSGDQQWQWDAAKGVWDSDCPDAGAGCPQYAPITNGLKVWYAVDTRTSNARETLKDNMGNCDATINNYSAGRMWRDAGDGTCPGWCIVSNSIGVGVGNQDQRNITRIAQRRISGVTSFPGKSQFTIIMWAKAKRAGKDDMIFSSWAGSYGSGKDYWLELRYDGSSSQVQSRRFTQEGGTRKNPVCSVYHPVDKWMYIAVRYTGSKMELIVGTDGILKTGQPNSDSNFSVNENSLRSDPVHLAARVSGRWNEGFQGLIGSFKAYNRSLSTTELYEDYENERINYETTFASTQLP